MYDIAEQVLAWQNAGRPVQLVRIIESHGFSSRERARAAAMTPGMPPVGSLLTSGSADHSLWSALLPDPLDRDDPRGVVELVVSGAQAADANLSCGGTARLLVQPASDFPTEVWAMLLGREVVCLVTELSGDNVGASVAFTSTTAVPADKGFRPHVERTLARKVSETVLLTELEPPVVMTTLSPVPTVLIVGEGSIADALVSQTRLLGWSAKTSNDAGSAVDAAGDLAAGDAMVILSHDRDVDGPALTAGLSGKAHYVGALGSRHTQDARVAWLTERGVPASDLARIHGPAGLDLGACTPQEIALSITAEIVAGRFGATGQPLRTRGGPVHPSSAHPPPAT